MQPLPLQMSLPGKHQAASAAFLAVVFVFPFGSVSPLFPALMLAFFLWFVGYSFIATRRYRFSLLAQLKLQHPLAFYALLAWLAVSVVSYWVNVVFATVPVMQKGLATIKYFCDFAMMTYAFALARLVLVSSLSATRIFSAFMYGCIMLVALLLIIYRFGDMPAGYAENWSVKPPIGIHVRVMGMIALISTLAAVVLVLFQQHQCKIRQGLLFFCLLVSFAFIVWTGSRTTGAVAFVTMLALAAMAVFYKAASLQKAGLIVVCFVLALPLSQPFSLFSWSGLQRAVATTQATSAEPASPTRPSLNEATLDKVSSGRLSIWKVAINGFMRSPWIGLGPYGYVFIPEAVDTDMYDHPHNMIIQFLVEWGILGTAALLLFLACLAWTGLKNLPDAIKNRDTDYLLGASMVFAFTVNGLTDGTYFVPHAIFVVTAFATGFPLFTSPMRERFRATLPG